MQTIFPLLLAVLVTAVGTSRAAPSKSFIEVRVRELGKRSTDSGASVTVTLQGNAYTSTLLLSNPQSSVFTRNFRYTVAKEDAEGRVYFEDETPSASTLREIEQNFFVDPKTDSAVSIKKGEGSSVKFLGVTDNLAVIPANESVHEVIQLQTVPEVAPFQDYIELDRELTFPPAASTRATINAEPEVWVVFDYENSQIFEQNREKILDYLGVYFHAINNRYATIAEPSIQFRISGVTTVSTKSAQPYIENNKVPDGSGADINQVLNDFSKWAYANQASGPKFDLVAVLSGEELQAKDSSGAYSKGVSGLAWVKAACFRTQDTVYSSSVSEDRGGYFGGVFTVAHELAHNLGAPHDGSGDAAQCSWSDGYIMSYQGWGTKNKFYFSPCSINLMKTYISSTQASCVNSRQSSTDVPISKDNVGDRYDMTQLCVKYTGQSAAVPEKTKTADELCKNLACRYPTPGKPAGYYSITTLNHPPGDYTPCGTNGGKCINGDCLVV